MFAFLMLHACTTPGGASFIGGGGTKHSTGRGATDTDGLEDDTAGGTSNEDAPFLQEPWAERTDDQILGGALWDDDQGDFGGGLLMITIDIEDEVPFELPFEVKTDWAVDGAEALLGATDITFVLTGFDQPNDVALEFYGIDEAGNAGNSVSVAAWY